VTLPSLIKHKTTKLVTFTLISILNTPHFHQNSTQNATHKAGLVKLLARNQVKKVQQGSRTPRVKVLYLIIQWLRVIRSEMMVIQILQSHPSWNRRKGRVRPQDGTAEHNALVAVSGSSKQLTLCQFWYY